MSRTHEQVVGELDSKIPRDAIEQRDGGSGMKLSYLSGHYVIDRLNKVLGIGNWAYTSEINLIHSGLEEGKYGSKYTAHYSAKVRLVVKFPNGETTEFGDFGYGDGTDKNSAGKCHELAIKEAITDGVKRCAKNLGMSMGLALYSKEQENVEENEPAPPTQLSPKAANAGPGPSPANLDVLLKSISATAKVAIETGRSSLDEIKADLKNKFGVDKKEALTPEQAREFLAHLKGKVA